MGKIALQKIVSILTALMGVPTAIVVGQAAVALGASPIWGWAVLITYWGATIGWWSQKFHKSGVLSMVTLFVLGLVGTHLYGFGWVAGAILLFTLMAGWTADKEIA